MEVGGCAVRNQKAIEHTAVRGTQLLMKVGGWVCSNKKTKHTPICGNQLLTKVGCCEVSNNQRFGEQAVNHLKHNGLYIHIHTHTTLFILKI
jgi:hypothetical protein